MGVRQFRPEDLNAIRVQTDQLTEITGVDLMTAGRMLAEHYAFSGWIDGKCIGAAGIIETDNPGRGVAWALISPDCGRHMIAATRAIREAIDLHPCVRVEMIVFADFKQGCRWAELLGFECETPKPMRQYSSGKSAFLYAKVKG